MRRGCSFCFQDPSLTFVNTWKDEKVLGQKRVEGWTCQKEGQKQKHNGGSSPSPSASFLEPPGRRRLSLSTSKASCIQRRGVQFSVRLGVRGLPASSPPHLLTSSVDSGCFISQTDGKVALLLSPLSSFHCPDTVLSAPPPPPRWA